MNRISIRTLAAVFVASISIVSWAEEPSTSFPKPINNFKTQCAFNIPMISEVLFVQDGEVIDFNEVINQGAGNPNAPYCTLSLSFSAYDLMSTTGKFALVAGTHEFAAPSVTTDSQDYFGTPGTSVHFFLPSSPSAQVTNSPFIGAHCFTPQGSSSQGAFTLSDVEQELTRRCEAHKISVEVVSETGTNVVKKTPSKKRAKYSKKWTAKSSAKKK